MFKTRSIGQALRLAKGKQRKKKITDKISRRKA